MSPFWEGLINYLLVVAAAILGFIAGRMSK
jgi:hypothetical protein